MILRDSVSGKEGITLAAILLFGPDELIFSVLVHYKTDAIYRMFNLDRYDDRDVITTNLLDSYDRLLEFGRQHLNNNNTFCKSQNHSCRRIFFIICTIIFPFHPLFFSSHISTGNLLFSSLDGNMRHNKILRNEQMSINKSPTISDILLQNGTANLKDFYPLTEVKTKADKESLAWLHGF